MTDVEQKLKRKRQLNPDRITLSKTAVENLQKLEAQVERTFCGMVKLKNKDLTNFLLEARQDELSNVELRMIKERYFDEVRAATWALQKLKEAKERGEELKLKEILAQIQAPLVKEKSKPKAAPKAKTEGDGHPTVTVNSSSSSGANNAHQGAQKQKAGV